MNRRFYWRDASKPLLAVQRPRIMDGSGRPTRKSPILRHRLKGALRMDNLEDEIYKLKCMHGAMLAACHDKSAIEDPVLAHFTMVLGSIIRDIERKQQRP